MVAIKIITTTTILAFTSIHDYIMFIICILFSYFVWCIKSL